MKLIIEYYISYAILVIIVGVVAVWIKTAASKYPPVAPDRHKVSGVDGWLLLLILGLMFLGPAQNVGGFDLFITREETRFPALKHLAIWNTYKTTIWWILFFVWAVGFYAGLGLVRERTRTAVKRAQLLLWIIGPVATVATEISIWVILALALPASSRSGIKIINTHFWSVFQPLFWSVIWAAIWSAYLSRSKRVAATYGSKDGVGVG